MGLSTVTYALCKKYTDESLDGVGALKGAPCKVRSVEKIDGRSIVTLEWKSDSGVVKTSEVYVNDGVSVWIANREYAVNDIVVKDNILYICETANSDATFDPLKWAAISSGSVGGDFKIIDTLSQRPSDLGPDDRQMDYCIEDGNFYLWNGLQWNNINAGIKIRELTQAQYNALSEAEQNNGTIYFVTDEQGGGGGGSAELTSDMTVVKAVGGISIGTTYTAGTSLEEILRDMLAPVLYPAFTNPSASISATGAKLLETGATLSTTMTVTFNRGSINPAYGTSGYRSGPATEYSLNGGTAQASNTFSVTVTSAQKTYKANVVYSAGEQPKDSAGRNYDSPLPAGNVDSNTITYEFVDAMWANTANIATVAKLSLVSKSTKQRDMVFPAQTVANPEVFDIPASWTVTAVQVKNDLSGAYEDALDQFTVTNTTHDDAAGASINYKRYTFNLGYDTGARTVRVKWS